MAENINIQNKNINVAIPFSDTYASVLRNICGKFEEIATRIRLEGSRAVKLKITL